MASAGPSGLLLLNKPSGITSHDCVARVRRLLKQPRAGHCGTLDPFATGLLLIVLGNEAARQDLYLGMEKEYRFTAVFGRATDSGDRDGKTLPCAPFAPRTFEELQKTLAGFVGRYWQVPPRYSALKVAGRALYEYARAGIEIAREPREVEVREFELLKVEGPVWTSRVICSKGTYIRVLAEDVAAHLGTGTMLKELCRERIGPYRLEDALTLAALEQSRGEVRFAQVA